MATTQPNPTGGRFPEWKDLPEGTGEVPAVPDPLVPNLCFGFLPLTTSGETPVRGVPDDIRENRQRHRVRRHRLSRSQVLLYLQRPPTTSATSGGTSAATTSFVLLVLLQNKNLKNRTRNLKIGQWFFQGLTTFLLKSCSFPNYFGRVSTFPNAATESSQRPQRN